MSPDEFRRLALECPGAEEREHGSHPDFRVGGKVFATLGWPDAAWAVVRLAPEEQEIRTAAMPDAFEPVPGAWGRRGYTRVRLSAVGEADARSALRAAWRGIAPKRLVAGLR